MGISGIDCVFHSNLYHLPSYPRYAKFGHFVIHVNGPVVFHLYKCPLDGVVSTTIYFHPQSFHSVILWEKQEKQLNNRSSANAILIILTTMHTWLNYTFIAFTLLKCNSYWTCHVHVPDEHDEHGLQEG